MREGWEKIKFADLFKNPKKAIISGPFGSNLKSAEYQTEGIPLVRLQNVDRWNFIDKNIIYITPQKAQELSSHSYRSGDILMTKLGVPLGKACIAPEFSGEGIVLADIVRIRVDENNFDKHFIVYQLNSEAISSQLKLLTTGATRPRVTLKNVRDLNFHIPSLQEQQQIVAILDQAFEAIDQAKANIEKNIANAKELFQSKLNAIFSQKGDGWEEKSLGEVCDETKNIKWQDYPTQEFEYVDLGSVSRESLSITETTTVNSKNAPSRAKKLINLGDVIFATTRPTLRRATIIKEELSGHICSTGFVVLRPKRNISSDWIFLYLLTTTFMERMETLQRGASYPAVSDNDVKGSKLSVPKSEIVEKEIILKMRKFQKKIDEIILQYQQKLNNLEDLKKSILQKAFAGELTNKDIAV